MKNELTTEYGFSATKLATYQTCPRLYFSMYVSRTIKEPTAYPNTHAIDLVAVRNVMNTFFFRKGLPFDATTDDKAAADAAALSTAASALARIRGLSEAGCSVILQCLNAAKRPCTIQWEVELGMTRDGKPDDGRDGWFTGTIGPLIIRHRWSEGKWIDSATIINLSINRPPAAEFKQREHYAALVMVNATRLLAMKKPKLSNIKSAKKLNSLQTLWVYLQEGKSDKQAMFLEDQSQWLKEIRKGTTALTKAHCKNSFDPTPSDFCKVCSVGDCPFNKNPLFEQTNFLKRPSVPQEPKPPLHDRAEPKRRYRWVAETPPPWYPSYMRVRLRRKK